MPGCPACKARKSLCCRSHFSYQLSAENTTAPQEINNIVKYPLQFVCDSLLERKNTRYCSFLAICRHQQNASVSGKAETFFAPQITHA